MIVRKLTREYVEQTAMQTLQKYQTFARKPLTLPININHICEGLYRLRCDWDVISEPPSVIILAGIYPEQKLIVMNETHANTYTAKPGLERYTMGHEVGHWVLHVDHGMLESGTLPGFEGDQTILCRDGDDSWVERQANWFSSGLLMPRDLFIPEAQQHDLQSRDAHHRLAEKFGVTVSAARVRMNQLGLARIDMQGYPVSVTQSTCLAMALG